MNCRQGKTITFDCECQFPPETIPKQFTYTKLKTNHQLFKNNFTKCCKISLRKQKSSHSCSRKFPSTSTLIHKSQPQQIQNTSSFVKKSSSTIPINFQYLRPIHESKSPEYEKKIIQAHKPIFLKPSNILIHTNHPQSYNNIQNKQNLHSYESTKTSNICLFRKQSFITQITDSNSLNHKVNFVYEKGKNPIHAKQIKKKQSSSIFTQINQSIKRPVSMGKLSTFFTKGKTLQDFASNTEIESVLGEESQNSQQFSQVIMSSNKIEGGNPLQPFSLTTFKLVTENDKQN